MGRDDEEFSAWLAARWPPLVRLLVFHGHPQPVAERVALDGLSRIYPTWQRLRREDDVDVELYREVLDERGRYLRHHGEEPSTPDPEPEVAPGLSEQAERRREVQAALAAMTPEGREVTLLRHVAELSDQQIADVRGSHPELDPGGPGADDVRFAAEAVQVGPLQPHDIGERVRARRRRWWRRGTAVVAALGVVVAGAAWFTSGADEGQGIRAARNPLPVPWYADDTLHLADVTVEMPGVWDLVQVPDGVVVTDDEGTVVMVDQQGRQEELGRTVPGSALVVEHENGWVGWADPGAGEPELVVHDTRAGEEVGRRSLSAPGAGGGQPVGENRPVAIDGERVYYTTSEADFAWEPLLGSAFAVAGSLVDTADGARVAHHAEGLLVQPAPFRVGFVVDAVDGRLTPDGRYLFTVDDREQLVVYDVLTSKRLPGMYSPSDLPVAWGYAGDGTFLFALVHHIQDRQYQDLLQLPSPGDYRIYRCQPRVVDQCTELAAVPEDVPDPPLIAR